MKINENEHLSGPAVQRREIFFVVALVACWGIALYFLVGKPAKKFESASRSSIRVNKNELAPAVLKKYLTEDNAPMDKWGAALHERPRMEEDAVDQTLRTMKEMISQPDESFSTLITAEPPPPDASAAQRLMLDEPVSPQGVEGQEATDDSTQSDDYLEPEPAEPTEQAPTTERIKS